MENRKIKILAIDDNRDNLITLKAIISEVLPHSVVYMELSGQGGIESARKNEPDVILLDIVMPGLDGYEVCKILKADEQLAETPIIFLTALKGDKQSRILALEAGGEAFLSKPIDVIELKAQIQAMLKIKEAAAFKRDQKLRLEELVQKRTQELKSANIAALNLLEDLKTENEIRKQRELELKKSEENLKLLNRAVEASSVSVVITDAEGNINYINPYFAELTGYSYEEALGENSRFLKSGNHPKTFYEELWNTILSGREWTGEFQNKKKNGELFWEKAVISPILNSKGVVTNFVAIKDDITERKKMLDELVAAKEKAEESDKLKSAFLANMSHEIRTPMNGILGFTGLLLEPDLSSEQKEAYINIVNQSGQRMLNTVNDIVEISKIEAGIVTINLKEVDVQLRLDEILRFFNPEATKKGLKLTLVNEVPKAVAIISTDQNKIDSIFTNLIKNAIKFTESGTIKVGCKIVETQGLASLQFYVKDTGIGIPDERKQAVFKRFIKADILDKDARQGSGLGLAITKAYVEMLGGKIRVESIINQGSTFFFTLPLNGQVQEKTGIKGNKNQEEKTSQIKGLHIVIAEDDETSALYLQTILQTVNSKIILTKNGNETVEACRINSGIDLVLMDIQMPDMNGYEATRRIREFNKDVVIIAQTAFALAGDRKKAINAGCNDYITKPIKKGTLLKKIQKYF